MEDSNKQQIKTPQLIRGETILLLFLFLRQIYATCLNAIQSQKTRAKAFGGRGEMRSPRLWRPVQTECCRGQQSSSTEIKANTSGIRFKVSRRNGSLIQRGWRMPTVSAARL